MTDPNTPRDDDDFDISRLESTIEAPPAKPMLTDEEKQELAQAAAQATEAAKLAARKAADSTMALAQSTKALGSRWLGRWQQAKAPDTSVQPPAPEPVVDVLTATAPTEDVSHSPVEEAPAPVSAKPRWLDQPEALPPEAAPRPTERPSVLKRPDPKPPTTSRPLIVPLGALLTVLVLATATTWLWAERPITSPAPAPVPKAVEAPATATPIPTESLQPKVEAFVEDVVEPKPQAPVRPSPAPRAEAPRPARAEATSPRRIQRPEAVIVVEPEGDVDTQQAEEELEDYFRKLNAQ